MKVVASSNQIHMASDDMTDFDTHLTNILKNLPNDCTIKYFENTLNKDIIPCLKYSGILCSFTEANTVEKYKNVRLTFEKKLFYLLEKWIDKAIKNNDQQEAKKIADLMLKILDEVEITPYLINSIVHKLSPDVLSKSSPHVAGGLTVGAATSIGIAISVMSPTTGLFVIVGGPTVGATIWNAIKADQKIIHIVGEKTKKYLPFLPNWSHKKSKLEYLSDPYEKVFTMASEKEAKFRGKRDSERKKVKALLKEIDVLLSKSYLLSNENYHVNKMEIRAYLISENEFYEGATDRTVKRKASNLQSSSREPEDVSENEETYNGKHRSLYAEINRFISKDEEYFEDFNATDKDQVISKIKSLRVSINRLNSAQNDFMDHGVVKKQVETSKSRVERISQSWVESIALWSKESVVETFSTVARKINPWAKADESKEP